MRQTSLDAYKKIKAEGLLAEQQRRVYAVLEEGTWLSDLEIAYQTGLPINCVTPRRGELVKMGLVELAGYDYGTKKRCLWKIKE